MSKPSFFTGNPYFSLLSTAWHYAREERRRYALTYGLFTLSNVSMSLTPIIWGMFINHLQLEGAQALRAVWLYAGAYFCIHLLDWAFHFPARLIERELAFKLSRNMLAELYHKTLRLPTTWHQDNHSGATINRVRKAYEAMRDFFDFGFAYFQTLARMFFALAAMVYFSPVFGLLALLLGLGIVMVILRFDRPIIAATQETNDREHEVSSTLFDSLSNIITVITLRLERRMEEGLMGRVAAVWSPFKRSTVINEWKWFTVESCIALLYGTIIVGYVYENWVPGEVFLVGGLVTLVGYVTQFTGVFQNFAWQYTQIVRYHTDVKAADNILSAYAEHKRPEAVGMLPPDWREIELRDLDFLHRTEAPAESAAIGLHGLNLRIRRGRRIALIGESGSGKSTLLALLRGLYEPEKVTVTVDGEPVPSLAAVNESVTLFPQEPEIFENTIAYNITLGLPAEEEELKRVCELVAFNEVVQQLPNGLESNIKEKGVNLSGGQKQRLALARGMLAAQRSDLILLDEPTSSVDPKTELQIYERMFDAFRDKAVISALHRLHLLRLFDYVYVMDQGEIVDEGTFDHLLQHSETFQELWRHQQESVNKVI